jgi:hypothetical protein
MGGIRAGRPWVPGFETLCVSGLAIWVIGLVHGAGVKFPRSVKTPNTDETDITRIDFGLVPFNLGNKPPSSRCLFREIRWAWYGEISG